MFIGFGGNVVREKVKAGAAWYVYRIQELIDELEHPKGKELEVVGEATIKNNFFGYDAGRIAMGTSPPLAANWKELQRISLFGERSCCILEYV